MKTKRVGESLLQNGIVLRPAIRRMPALNVRIRTVNAQKSLRKAVALQKMSYSLW